MGFAVDYVADIQKFPYPLFTKFKKKYVYSISAQLAPGRNVVRLADSLPQNTFDLQQFTINLAAYDIIYREDVWWMILETELIYNSHSVMSQTVVKNIQPVIKYNSGDALQLLYENMSNTTKLIKIDIIAAYKDGLSAITYASNSMGTYECSYQVLDDNNNN